MKCKNCEASMFDKPLHRTNPLGQSDAGWMCEDCIANNEPELYQNLKDDNDLKIANEIMEIIKDSPTYISDFKLVGLSKSKSFTLELLESDKETFWATSNMEQERFDALFDYCKNNWEDKKIAEVKHNGLTSDGIPINPLVINIREWDL